MRNPWEYSKATKPNRFPSTASMVINTAADFSETFPFFPKAMERIDLDRELRKRAVGSIVTNPDDLMDNWYLSALELRRQRYSENPDDRNVWKARRALDPGQYPLKGAGAIVEPGTRKLGSRPIL